MEVLGANRPRLLPTAGAVNIHRTTGSDDLIASDTQAQWDDTNTRNDLGLPGGIIGKTCGIPVSLVRELPFCLAVVFHRGRRGHAAIALKGTGRGICRRPKPDESSWVASDLG